MLGTVYKAVDEKSRDTVSLQVFTPVVGKDPVLSEALEQYAANLSQLNHTNIQRVISFKNGDAGCVLIKEHINAERLDSYLEKQGILDWQLALRLLKQLLYGLSCAHDAGIVHCSLSPDNIYITQGNVAKISDIGLIQIIKENSYLSEEEWRHSTARKYAAPEAFSGDFITANEASDVYSVGLIGYQMLTGISPGGSYDSNYFVANNYALDANEPAHHHTPSIPEKLSLIIEKATEHHAIHRYPNAVAMLNALHEINFEVPEKQVVYHKRSPVPRIRFNASYLLILGTLLAVLSAGFFFIKSKNQNPFLALQHQSTQEKTQDSSPKTPITIPAEAAASPTASLPAQIDTLESQTTIPEPVPEIIAVETSEKPDSPQQDEQPAERYIPSDIIIPEPATSEAQRPVPPSAPIFRTLIVRSQPTGAAIAISGKEMGKTPFRLSNIQEQRASIRLSLPGH